MVFRGEFVMVDRTKFGMFCLNLNHLDQFSRDILLLIIGSYNFHAFTHAFLGNSSSVTEVLYGTYFHFFSFLLKIRIIWPKTILITETLLPVMFLLAMTTKSKCQTLG